MGLTTISMFVPVTVISAVALFIVKELVEVVRRFRADRRRIMAMKMLLAEEIEQNHWTYNILKRTLQVIGDILRDYPNPSFRIVRTQSGRELFRYRHDAEDDAGFESGHPLPAVRQEQYERLVLDIASMDKQLFSLARTAYDAIKEMEHVRSSLVDMLDRVDPEISDGFFESFLAYADDELNDTYEEMKPFYFHIAGKELTENRMR